MYQRVGTVAYKADLVNTLALCEALDNPHKKFRSVHIAGTNGKGSTSHMLAAILQSAGYTTGLYTSPHLKEFTERIRIDGQEISREFVVDFVARIKPEIDRIQPSFFEMTVAMAFDYFASQKVDIAVIEVGLGGRLDSTNVITPVASLITNISFDHMDLLGDTLSKIASEKAGIIKAGIPVVISEDQQEVKNVFKLKAKEVQAPIFFATESVSIERAGDHFDVRYNDLPWLSDVTPQLNGNYQQRNLPGVLKMVRLLNENGFNISDQQVIDGIEHVVDITHLKGRWQKLSELPLVICDTGHNPDGIREVVEQIKSTPHNRLHVVLGMVKEKDLTSVIGLLPKEANYYFCQAKIPRALDADLLMEKAAQHGLRGVVIKDVNEAIREARRHAAAEDIIFIGGSTFVVAEIEGL